MKTTYLKNKLLEHKTGKTTFTKPTNTYVGLLSADPTVAGLLANEVVGNTYARAQVTWGSAADGLIASTNLLDLGNLPSTNVRYWGIFDAATDGNLLEYYPFPQTLVVSAGLNFTIDAGNLILREE